MTLASRLSPDRAAPRPGDAAGPSRLSTRQAGTPFREDGRLVGAQPAVPLSPWVKRALERDLPGKVLS